MPTPIVGEPISTTPEAGGKLPIPGLNPVQIESAYQDMRSVLKTAAGKKSLSAREEIKTSLDDGATLKIEDVEKDELLRTLNEDHGDTVSASEKIDQCETTWEQTGKQFRSEEKARKTGGLVTKDEGFGGKFYRIDPLKSKIDKDNPENSVIVTIEDDVSPTITKGVRGLRRQISEGDAQAQKTYETLRDGNSVRVTYNSVENGAPQEITVTLKEFDDLLEKEAADLWTQAHGGDMSFADAKAKFPQVAHAYRIKAEKKFASDAKYTLHHSEEPKPDKADTAKPEAEKNKEGTAFIATLTHDILEDTAGAAIQGVTKKDTDGNDVIAEEALSKLPPSEQVATLSLLVSTYNDILKDPNRQGQRDNLMTLAYVHLKNIKLDTITDPRLRDRLESLQKGNALFDGEQGRVTKLQARIHTHWLAPHQLGQIPLEQLTRDMILAIKLEATKGVNIVTDARGQFQRFEVGADVEKLLASWDVKDDERQKIFHLATGDQSSSRMMSQEFGFDTQALINSKSGEAVAQKVMTALTGSVKDRGKSEDYYKSKEKQDAFLKFFRHNLSEESLKEFAKKHGFPPQMGMGVLILALFLPMIQGVMDTGGGGGEERGGGSS